VIATGSVTQAFHAGASAACVHFGLEKQGFIPKLIRALETPIPGTPKLLMAMKSPEQLAASEMSRRGWMRENVHGGLNRLLKGVKLDKGLQALEPLLGDATAPEEMRRTFGERGVFSLAHTPVQSIANAIPIGGVGKGYQAARTLGEKLFHVPGPPSFQVPTNQLDVDASQVLDRLRSLRG
jgi:hypothetical protein